MLETETVKSLNWAHPLVRDWFLARFGSPTEPQEIGWPCILSRKATLISAPTGSGKTLAAFLACIDALVRKACEGKLENKTEVIYISPLKALSNDVQKNLQGPLQEIAELAARRGISMQEIRTAVRTGDTLEADRRSMLKYPPHILVTTPESLYILLTAEKSRGNLVDVDTIIVDEIHAVADDKRGAHLSLSLERLELLCKAKPVRIGLSATQKPIETVARFLVGNGREMPVIVNEGHKRKLDFAVEVPGMPLAAVASNEQWEETYDRIAQLVEEHRSTLIFVNTRKMAERLTLHLGERLGEESVAAHHGSLSRKLRHDAENKLKKGELRALVATASLELGIDVGAIDLVCLISSPRSIAVALQRIGRAGHWRGAIPKGRIFPTTRDELLECAALVKAIRDGELDRLWIPEKPLDILAQQIVAMCSAEEWNEDALYETVKAAAPYESLSRDEYNKVIEMLAEGISARRGRYSSYLLWNRVEKILKGRRGARLAAITSGGAIPETGLYSVVALPEETLVGTVDEDFAVESMRGDIFLLGNTSWQIRRVESARGRVLVEDAHGQPPTIPFWLGEAPPRTTELSHQVATIRETISKFRSRRAASEYRGGPFAEPASKGQRAERAQAVAAEESEQEPATLIELLQAEYGLDQSGAEQAIEYVIEARAVLGDVPTQETLIAERFFDEGGGMQLVIHSPYGARINKAWGLALRKCFCRSFNFELQAAATDNGLNISLGEQHSFPLADVFNFLSPESVRHVLEQASLASPIFNTRFRWDANRSLALLRFQGGKKVPPYLQRLKSDDLLAAVFPQAAACQDNIVGDIELPDHPLINEVMKDVLTEAMDIDGLTELLKGMQSGRIRCLAIDTPIPSAFAHEILNANPYAYLDDAPLEERRARAVELRRVLPDNLKEVAMLDPAAIAQVVEEAWPDLRDCDELHDLLQSLIAIPEDLPRSIPKQWHDFLAELVAKKRAAKAEFTTSSGSKKTFWLVAEKRKAFDLIYPSAELKNELAELEDLPDSARSAEEGIISLLQGWLAHCGPITAAELEQLFAIPLVDLDYSLIKLESTGAILRGQFRAESASFRPGSASFQPGSAGFQPASEPILEWCDRRLLARIHKLTVGALRKGIEPVTPAQYMNWLLQWQHLAAGTQLPADERGLLEIIRQLQGFELPANAWEHLVLARRVKDYDPSILDVLCLTGKIGWGRISPHPATMQDAAQDEEARAWRVTPTSVAPISFFLRDDCDWMPAIHPGSLFEDNKGLSHEAIAVKEFLKQRGASFFADIQRGTNRLQAEIENALWELVAAGLVTADGFDNLRALIDPKRRLGQGRSRMRMPRHCRGRWSLLYTDAVERNKQLESICKTLLRRYGVVVREVLTRERIIPRWRELLMAFRRLEDRGEIRGGRFVSGFMGEQFALPEAVESLRAARTRSPKAESELMRISAADPLNLIGIIIPGKRNPAVSTNTVLIKDGAEYTAESAASAPKLA